MLHSTVRAILGAALCALMLACSPPEGPGVSYDVVVSTTEVTGSTVHVVIQTAPKAWLKVMDKAGRNELPQTAAKPSRGNADDKGRFEFEYLAPKPANAVMIIAHEGTKERGRRVVEFAYAPTAVAASSPPAQLPSHTFSIAPASSPDGEDVDACRGGFETTDAVTGHVRGCKMRILPGGKVSLQVKGTPAAQVSIAGASATLGADGTGNLEATLATVIGDTPLTKIGRTGRYPVLVPVAIALAGGQALTGRLTLPGLTLGPIFQGLEKGPIRFAGADAADAVTIMLYVEVGYSVSTLGLASRKMLRDVDLVAVGTPKIKQLGTCRYGSKGEFEKHRTQHDIDVRVYDRRSGKKVGAKFFAAKAPHACAKVVSRSQAGDALGTRVADADVRRWLETLL